MSNHKSLQDLWKNKEKVNEEDRSKYLTHSTSKGTGKRITEEDKRVWEKLFTETPELTTEDGVYKLPRYDKEGNDNKDLLKATISKYNENALKDKKGDTALIIWYYVTKQYILVAKVDLQRCIDLSAVEIYKENKVAMTRKKLDTLKYLNGDIDG